MIKIIKPEIDYSQLLIRLRHVFLLLQFLHFIQYSFGSAPAGSRCRK